MNITIVGAGIGGLVAALALTRDGHEVTVYERTGSAGASALGSGLSLFANTFAALDAVSLGDVVEPLVSNTASLLKGGQRTPSGSWLTRMPAGATESLRVVHRAELHEALITALPAGVLRTGSTVTVSADGAPTVAVNGQPVESDVVIAADGIRSAARAALGEGSGLRYSGYTAWRGISSGVVELQGEAGETWGRGSRFGYVPLRDGRVYWFGVHNAAANSERVSAGQPRHAEVLALFESWHRPIPEIIHATEPSAVLRHDLYDLATPVHSYRRGRTVLLGDAAHAMTPNLGQGAGQAIEDAATLALLLRSVSDATDAAEIDAALDRYDRVRRPRSQGIAARSRQVGQIGQLANPLAVLLRDTALRLTPAAVLQRQLRATHHWQPPSA